MQDFHYKYSENKHVDKAEMLLADDDSLIYKTEAKNVYESFYKDKEIFDFSNYPKDSKHFNNANNLVVAKMKNETPGVSIKCFLGLNLECIFSSLKTIINLKKQNTLIKILFMMN